MNPFVAKINSFITSQELIVRGDRLLLSVSAGKDSMAMLHLLLELAAEYGVEIGGFHLNHQVRGQESDDDEQFVVRLFSNKNIPLFTERYDFAAHRQGGISFEEQARNVRYRLLHKLADAHGYNKIVTAHTGSDNVETILMRIFTGTGIHGLTGIPSKRGMIIRPMLNSSSEEIYRYCTDNSISWREDSSNKDNEYTRNYIRNVILPLIHDRFPMADSSIETLSGIAESSMLLQKRLLEEIHGPLYRRDSTGIYITINTVLGDYPAFSALFTIAVKDNFGFHINSRMIREIFRRLHNDRANIPLYRNGAIAVDKIYRNGSPLIWIRKADNDAPISEWGYELSLRDSIEQTIQIPEIGISIALQFTDYAFYEKYKKNQSFIFIALDKSHETLYIRNRRTGDRIKTEGGTKKIKKILIEKKLDNYSKNCVPLLKVDNIIAAIMPGLLFDISNRVAVNFLVEHNSEKILAIYKNQH